MENTKSCFKCGETKPLSAFYKHPQMADGRLNKCKECNKSDVTKNRTDNIEKYRAYDRKRGNRQSPEYSREHYKKNKKKRLSDQRQWRDSHPEEYKARNAVSNAVRDGRLTKLPCEVCGSIDKIHGHHDDYSKPLEVRWLCPKHHGEAHREINDTKRNSNGENHEGNKSNNDD